ncbi:MAG: MBOAT family protein [Proteiniphilum sp.]|jgi:alginate O-acetyltransferase complex protein AlgI|nr:MBOAT family protein [Proteiniphilum sp.]
MTFSSISFFIFFTVVILVMLVTKIKIFSKRKLRHTILLVASYLFYGWWNWRFCFLMLVLTVAAYISAIQIDRKPENKFYLYSGIIIPLVILGIFKYFNFFVSSFAEIFGIHNTNSLNIILPVGISFYTFQSLSYTIDVYRKKSRVEKNFIRLALYISFFPQLVAGPIVRASDFLPQLDEERNVNSNNFKTGIQIFSFGLFKKIVVADWLSVFVDNVFRTPGMFHAISLILAVIAYSIQIYFDFSGYSDMAIGCAKCLGYDFARNFNLPYISGNITEFWRRWHISLSSWLKEYLYIPLGGNRKGNARTYINNMITMLLGGLWHGANWTFLAWGGIHGIALCVHKIYKDILPPPPNTVRHIFAAKILNFIRCFFAVLLTNLFVCFCWILFRADSFSTAGQIIIRIITWQNGIIQIYSWVVAAILILLSATITAIIRAYRTKSGETNGFYVVLDLSKFWHLVIFFLFIGLIIGLAFVGTNPFIYFQF